MEPKFAWREEFNIGIPSIDKEHQLLFKIINKMFALKEEDKNNQWICQEGIKYFKTHAVEHFADEEAYMASIGYTGLAAHQLVHKGFREYTLPALERELEATAYSPESIDHFLGVCAGWLIGHTLTEDLAITGHSVRKWEKLLPGEEQTALKKVLLELVFEMFHLESHLISDTYSGEQFGSGVYYRLVYGSGSRQEKLEVYMVLEDRLLINTVGKIVGIQTNKLDSVLIHAARYTTRQFVSRVIEHFPAIQSYELKEENLLSYEQFRESFKRETFQSSLLFDTGDGYFAFCAIAPHLLDTGIGTPIEAGNATSEIENYLANREENPANQKRKILIVDDSATIRQGMQTLLSDAYDISLADSAAAAIRTASINRPDLILLDYEMPVCDGRQTLEMLRSVPELSAIPVIFLTGRRDPETMIQVMPLKPEGYLLKGADSAKLKQEIDAFFEKAKG